jgi:hypothetical protein
MRTPVSHRTAGREQPGTRTEQSGGSSGTIFRSSFFFRRSEGGDVSVARQTLLDKHRSLFYQVCTWTNETKGELKGGCSNPDKRTEKRDQKAEENADP